MKRVNLAAQPFRNERLPGALFAVACVLLAGLSVKHAFVVRDLLPSRTSGLHREVAALESELSRLRREAQAQRGPGPEPSALAQWTLVKDLVDRRAFSWTGLFVRLEGVIPDEMRLVSIRPSVRKGRVILDVTAAVRTPQAGWEFVRLLEEQGDFSDVYPLSESEERFVYTMRYAPRHAPPPQAAGAEARPTSPRPGGGGAAR